MKDPLNRTKVVIRRLPPSISESMLRDQIDGRFSGRYNWFLLRPGKFNQKIHHHSRAYINFNSPEDVLEFAEYFDGHIFVNEKGSQFRALVEYAPSQCVPRLTCKKDGREGTIVKDPEYLQFLDFIAKPFENLPSAEIQLERREAERAGEPKDVVIVTSLMEFIRQKRASKKVSQRSSANGKFGRRGVEVPSGSSNASKRSSDRRRSLNSVYVLGEGAKNSSSGKDKPSYMIVSRKENQQLLSASRIEPSENGTVSGSDGTIHVASGSVEIGKKRVVLLKGKERDTSHVSGGLSQQHNATASVRNVTSLASKQSQRHVASGKNIKSILSNKDARQSQSYTVGAQPEQQTQEVNCERDKRPPRPPNSRLIPKDHTANVAVHSSAPYNDARRPQYDKVTVSNLYGSVSISHKSEKHMKNKDRPDRGVWTPRRSDGGHVTKNSYLSARQSSNSVGLSPQMVGHTDGDDTTVYGSSNRGCGGISRAVYNAALCHGDMNSDLPSSNRNAESRSGCANISLVENGPHKHVESGGLAHGMTEVDGPASFSESKLSKRAIFTGHGVHERQVWVQRSGSGS